MNQSYHMSINGKCPNTKGMTKMRTNDAGFTLVELLLVIAILGILTALAVPTVSQLIERSERESCEISVKLVEEHYHNFLLLEGLDHTNPLFQFFLNEQMDYNKNEHTFIYQEGHVRCTNHQPVITDEDEEEPVPVPVPWL